MKIVSYTPKGQPIATEYSQRAEGARTYVFVIGPNGTPYRMSMSPYQSADEVIKDLETGKRKLPF